MFQYFLQILVTCLTEGSIYALVGIGLVIIHRTTEVLFFAQGTIAMVAGVAVYSLINQLHLPLPLAILISLIICIGFMLLSEWLVVLPLLDRGANPFNVSIVTIGIALLFEMGAMTMFGKEPLTIPSFSGDKSINLFGASVAPQQIWVMGTTLIALLISFFFFKNTWTGKAMTGMSSDPLLAKASGFPIKRLFSFSFIFSALVVGFAGIVSAPISYTGYFIGTRLTVKGFIAAAIGGINNPLGAVIGGIMTAFFEYFGAGLISSGLKDLITIILLLFILFWRPQGLMKSR